MSESKQPDDALRALCVQWMQAKAKANAAAEELASVDAQIVAVTGVRDKGTATSKAGEFKIEVTGRQSVKMDWDAWKSVQGQFPAELRAIKQKDELDEKGMEWLRANRPELDQLLPFTITPGKTGVKVTQVSA